MQRTPVSPRVRARFLRLASAGILSGLFSGALSGPIAAQMPPAYVSTGSSPVSGTASFGDAAFGNVAADGFVDAVFLDGGALKVAMSPEAWTAVGDLSTAATAFALVPGATSAGLDAIVYSGTNGVLGLEFAPSSGTFAESFFATSKALGARRLRVADVDGDSSLDLVALAANGLRLYDYDDVVSLPAPTNRGFTTQAEDFVLVDWDGSGDLEAMCVTSNALFLVPTGTGVASTTTIATYSDSIVALASFHDFSIATDRVAVVASGTGGDALHVVDAGGSESISLSTAGVLAAVAGDLNCTTWSSVSTLTNRASTSAVRSVLVLVFILVLLLWVNAGLRVQEHANPSGAMTYGPQESVYAVRLRQPYLTEGVSSCAPRDMGVTHVPGPGSVSGRGVGLQGTGPGDLPGGVLVDASPPCATSKGAGS